VYKCNNNIINLREKFNAHMLFSLCWSSNFRWNDELTKLLHCLLFIYFFFIFKFQIFQISPWNFKIRSSFISIFRVNKHENYKRLKENFAKFILLRVFISNRKLKKENWKVNLIFFLFSFYYKLKFDRCKSLHK